ncbi:MlaD family protein [Iodobacter ciconiae]|nr:MlaD family protein [Iodobacter ciconiae]
MSVDLYISLLKKDNRVYIGGLMSGCVFVVAVAVYVLARSLSLFEQSYSLEFQAAGTDSLYKGMLVRLSGRTAGKIIEISREKETRVRVQMLINKDFKRWIKSDSVVSLAREGIFGERFIQISVGESKGPSLESGSELVFDAGMNVLLQQLRAHLFRLQEEIQGLAALLESPDGHTLGEVRGLLKELHSTRTDIDKTLASAALLAYENIPDTLGYVEGTLAGFKKAAQSMDARLVQISMTLEVVLDRRDENGVDKTLKEVQASAQEARPLLQKAIKDTDVVIKNAYQAMMSINDDGVFGSKEKLLVMPEVAVI